MDRRGADRLGDPAAQCPATLAAASLRGCRTQASARPAEAVLVDTAPGPAGVAALARQASIFQGNTTLPTVPTALASFGESANFPLLVAIVVAVCGTAALAHLMAVSVGRRRRESSLLKALGFVRPQLAAMVFWQAVAVDAVGIAVGVPLGIAIGRAVWLAFAANLGVVPFTVYPGWLLAAIAAGLSCSPPWPSRPCPPAPPPPPPRASSCAPSSRLASRGLRYARVCSHWGNRGRGPHDLVGVQSYRAGYGSPVYAVGARARGLPAYPLPCACSRTDSQRGKAMNASGKPVTRRDLLYSAGPGLRAGALPGLPVPVHRVQPEGKAR